MTSYQDVIGDEDAWSDSNFTYSLDASNAIYHLFSLDIDDPIDGNSSYVISAINAWCAVANITFSIDNDDPEIGFYEADMPTEPEFLAGRTYGYDILTGERLTDVEIFVNDDSSYFYEGEKAFTYLHELGHALGLQHPDGDGENPSYTRDMTIMSYNDGTYTTSIVPSTPMLYDIAAIQFLYGVNNDYYDGNTTYTLNGNGTLTRTEGGSDTISSGAMTIWDAGGNDTIDASVYNKSVILDLREGVNNHIETGDSHIWLAIAVDDVTNASGADIEAAIGGNGHDEIYGNDLNNTLQGNFGNDTLDGGTGNDSLIGGSGADRYNFASGHGTDTVTDSGLSDQIWYGGSRVYGTFNESSIPGGLYQLGSYSAQFSGTNLHLMHSGSGTIVLQNFVSGNYGIVLADQPASGSVIYGYDIVDENDDPIDLWSIAGAYTLDGGEAVPHLSDDSLTGTSGDDTIEGWAGDDTIFGGAGNDVLRGYKEFACHASISC